MPRGQAIKVGTEDDEWKGRDYCALDGCTWRESGQEGSRESTHEQEMLLVDLQLARAL